MNHADFGLGTWQPTNGFYDVVNAMVDLGKSLGVKYYTNHDVSSLNINEGKVETITINNKLFVRNCFQILRIVFHISYFKRNGVNNN